MNIQYRGASTLACAALVVTVLAGCGSPGTSPSARGSASASATPRVLAGNIVFYPLPAAQWFNGFTNGIAAGPDGNVWFTEPKLGKVAFITPAGKITEFPVPGQGAPGFLTTGSDKNLWVTEADGKIDRVTATGAVVQFPLLQTFVPAGIVAGPGGAVWMTTSTFDPTSQQFSNGDVIGISPDGSPKADYPVINVDGATSRTTGICAGPNGNIWIGGYGTAGDPTSFVQMLTLSDLTPMPNVAVNPDQNLYPVSSVDEQPEQLACGPRGDVWFIDINSKTKVNSISRITTSGKITEYPIAAPTGETATPYGISLDSDGNVWFTEQDSTPPDAAGNETIKGGAIDSIAPATGVITRHPLPTVGGGLTVPTQITAGPDGSIWFTASTGTKDLIGKLS